MPRFLHQGDPDLSDLNRAKKQLNRDYAKQYQSQDGLHDNLGQTADVDSIYNTLSTRLLGLQTALQDVYNILAVGSGVPRLGMFSPSQRANFQQFASRVLTEVGAVQTIMSRIKGFDMFTPPQAQGLQALVAEIEALDVGIDGVINTIGGDVVGQQLADVIQTYERPIKLLLQFLDGASRNYKAIEANPKTIETRYGRGWTFDSAFDDALHSGLGALDNVYNAYKGGAIIPAYNGEGHFGSDGYRIGEFFTYSSPRRFY
jgi:hypothetical protein